MIVKWEGLCLVVCNRLEATCLAGLVGYMSVDITFA